MNRGLTLIEVVASLVLISLAASTALSAYTRSLDQWRSTKDLAAANDYAQELMTQWRLERPEALGFLVGSKPEDTEWSYRRTSVRAGGTDECPMLQHTLDVYHASKSIAPHDVATFTWVEPCHDQ